MPRYAVSAGSVRLAYDVAGDPAAPPMVLLHGLGADAWSWEPVLPALAERFRVYAVDLRGHGDSERATAYSFALLADDVAGALDALGVGEAVLVGHSMGGSVALRVAAARPDLVARLVIEDSCPPYERDRPPPDRPTGDLPFDWEAVLAIATEVGVEDPAAWAELAEIAAPTLVVAGGPTSHVPQDLVARVAAAVPGADLVTIPVGHEVHAAAPEEFARVLLDWLA